MQQRQKSPENTLFHILGDVMTGGMWTMTYGVFFVLRNINAWLILPFLRFNIGRKLFTFGIWFWGVSYCFCYWMFNYEGWWTTDASTVYHSQYIFLHGQFFSAAYILQALWSWLRFQFGKISLPINVGDSILYYLFLRWWMRPLGLTGGRFGLTEIRWLKFGEPVFLFFLISHFAGGAYATFLFISLACYTWHTWGAIGRTEELMASQAEGQTYRDLTQPYPNQQRRKEKRHVIGGE